MRIVINGWFTDQPTTGSGQYLDALLAWLPRVGGEHEFIVVRPQIANGKSANQQTSKPANQRICESHHAIRTTQYAIRTTQYISRLSPSLAKLWFEQVAFPLACRRLRADVAFVPYWGSPFWSPCPVVVTVHDLIPLLLPLYRGGPLQRAYTALVSRTARSAAAVLTDSAASQRDIIAHLGIPPARVHAIHLAADPRYHAALDPAELARVRAKYALPDAPFLLYLGGFDARKNVVRMVEAFARVVRRQGSGGRDQEAGVRSQREFADPCPLTPVPCLVIAGKLPAADTPFTPDPRPVVARLGIAAHVYFTGWVDEADKPALYALAVGTVFVSEYEGFGLGVVEGMGVGHEAIHNE
jgi:glycosyltransferase involved in cell wall biosynthesis